MRAAAIADIHGNLPALEAILADARQEGAVHYLIAGDLLARAPYPRETLRLLQSLGAWVIRGNADQYQVDYAAALERGDPPDGATLAVVGWTHRQIGAAGARYLESLPPELSVLLPGWPPLRIVHASPGSLSSGLVPNHPHHLAAFRESLLWLSADDPPPLAGQLSGVGEGLLVCGHTHIPWVERAGGVLAINPGAAGIPTNGDPRAQYALLDWRSGEWVVELRAVDYDHARLKAAYINSGLLDEGGPFARACLACAMTGRNAAMRLILAARQRMETASSFDDALLQAGETFPWHEYCV